MRRIGNQPTGFGGPGVREVRNRPTNSSHFKGGGCEAALQPRPSAPDGHAAQPAPRGRFHGQAHRRTRFGGRASREGDQEAEASHSVPSRMPNKRPAAAASSSRWVWTSRIVGGGTTGRVPGIPDQPINSLRCWVGARDLSWCNTVSRGCFPPSVFFSLPPVVCAIA